MAWVSLRPGMLYYRRSCTISVSWEVQQIISSLQLKGIKLTPGNSCQAKSEYFSIRCLQTIKQKLGDELSYVSPLLGLQIMAGQLMPKRLWACRKVAGSLVPRAAPKLMKCNSPNWQSHVLVTDTKASLCASYLVYQKTNSKEMRCSITKNYCGVWNTCRVMYVQQRLSSIKQKKMFVVH